MPVAYTTINFAFDMFDQSAGSGSVAIVPSVPALQDIDGHVLLAGNALRVTLGAAGTGSIILPATDNTADDVNPTGFTYTAYVTIGYNEILRRTFALPSSPATVDFDTLVDLDPAAGTYPDPVSATGLDALVAGLVADAASETQPALDTRFVRNPAAPSDGYLLAWSDALGEYVETAPTGESELVAAVNATGTPTTVSATSGPGAQITIVGSSIVVPASSRPVTLFYEAGFAQTTVGTGSALVSLYETTGAATQLDYVAGTLPNSTATGLREVSLSRSYRLGATVATRTFELRAWIYQVSGSPAGSILNSTLRQTSFRAVAG